MSITTLNSAYTQNFNTLGSLAAASLPTGWAFSNQANYTSLATATTLAAGNTGTGSLTGTSSGGYYNFADGITASSTDRAIGFLTSGSFTSPRYLYFVFTNNTGATVSSLNISFDYEKYRSGTRAFDLTLSTSTNASAWTNQSSGSQNFASDASNTVISNPELTTAKSLTLTGLSIENGENYYLRWSYVGSGGNTNAQAIGIDNFSLTAIPEPSTYAAIFGALALAGVVVHRRRQARR